MLSETGATPVVQSKWFATVVVESPDSTVAELWQQLAIVDSGKRMWKGNLRVPAEEKREDRFVSEDEPLHNEYGYSYKQIKMLNGMKDNVLSVGFVLLIPLGIALAVCRLDALS